MYQKQSVAHTSLSRLSPSEEDVEKVLTHTQSATMDMPANVVLDIESLAQTFDKCAGSPKLSKALSRKSSCRIDRKVGEEQEPDESSKKLVVKVGGTQLEPLISNKPLVLVTAASNCASLSDAVDGRTKKFNRFITVHPKEILLIFAALSSVGTLILIYFTLLINRTGGL